MDETYIPVSSAYRKATKKKKNSHLRSIQVLLSLPFARLVHVRTAPLFAQNLITTITITAPADPHTPGVSTPFRLALGAAALSHRPVLARTVAPVPTLFLRRRPPVRLAATTTRHRCRRAQGRRRGPDLAS